VRGQDMALPQSLHELNPGFKYEVAEKPGGEHIKACFACGVCTGGCPVAEVDDRYDPRKIIRMIMLGMKERVLSSDFIWLCSLCNTCSFICPQDVRFSEAMEVLREMAVQEGYVHPSFPKALKEIEAFVQTIRDRMVTAVINKRKEEIKATPRDILKEITEKIYA
jgi:heterodisulfide reductase subunit C